MHRLRHTKAFTLVELLVVVAIIIVLVALLLPELSKARETARRTACGSSMRGISVCIAEYAAVNVDVAPTQDVRNDRVDEAANLRSDRVGLMPTTFTGLGLLIREGELTCGPNDNWGKITGNAKIVRGCPDYDPGRSLGQGSPCTGPLDTGADIYGHYTYIPPSHDLSCKDPATGIYTSPSVPWDQRTPLNTIPDRILFADKWCPDRAYGVQFSQAPYYPSHGLYYFNLAYNDGHVEGYSGPLVANAWNNFFFGQPGNPNMEGWGVITDPILGGFLEVVGR